MQNDEQAAGCSECEAGRATTASYCGRCFRPFPLLKTACDFVPAGRIDDVLGRSADRAREKASAATQSPLPAAIVDDLQHIRMCGRPQRDGLFLVGTPSSVMVQLRRWGFAVPFLTFVIAGLGLSAYQKLQGQPGFALFFLVAVVAGLVVGLIGMLLGRLFANRWIAVKQKRLGDDHLAGDRREFLFIAPEGLLRHSGQGLSFIPWKNVADVQCPENAEEQRTLFTWADTRTGACYEIESVGFVGTYFRGQLRQAAAATAARAGGA